MKIALVGLGQIGTSIGLALKAVSDVFEIVGHEPDDERVKRARKLKAVDSAHWNLISACDDAEVIVIDQSLGELTKTLAALAEGLESGEERPLIIDTCRSKRPVMALAAANPGAYDLIGGDPVAPMLDGRGEPSGELFQGGVFYLVAGQATPPLALDRASNLAQALGATPRFIDAVEHDGLMAAMTQMPVLANLAVLGTLGDAPGGQDRAAAVGALLASLGQVPAPEDAAEWLANRDNLVHWLGLLGREVLALRDLLRSEDDAALTGRVKEAVALLEAWQSADRGDDLLADQPGMLRSMFLGNLGRKRRD